MPSGYERSRRVVMNPSKLNSIQRNIMALYLEDKNVVNDDANLIASYWRKFDGWSDNRCLEENIKYATRPDTITRRKRELRESGNIIYSEQRDKETFEAYKNEIDIHSDQYKTLRNILFN